MTERKKEKLPVVFIEVKGVAEQIMKEACNKVCYVSRIIEKGNESDVDTGVSVDDTWHK